MMKVNMSWAEIKAQRDTYNHIIHCNEYSAVIGERSYDLIIINGPNVMYILKFREGEDGTDPLDIDDFETNYKASVNKPTVNVNSKGGLITQLAPSGSLIDDTNVHGAHQEITKQQTSNVDYVFTELAMLNGVGAWAWNAAPGDYAFIHVIDNASTPNEIGLIGKNLGIRPDGLIPMIISHKVKILPAGYGIRLKYTSVGASNNPYVGIDIKYLNTPV